MIPPAIDRAVGIEVYSTGFAGTGGRIRKARDHFLVEEMLDATLDVVPRADETHAYPLYLLTKEGIDSTHALEEVRSEAGLRLKVVGLKDARAVTKQFASATSKNAKTTERCTTRHCSLELAGFTNRPITKRVLMANRFVITVSDLMSNAQDSLEGLQDSIRRKALANFYGHQRFGSTRPVTHLVGRAMIRRDFAGAVEVFLTHTGEHEDEGRKDLRAMCREPSRFQEALRLMPRQMDLERALITAMIESNDPLKAMRKLPVSVRRLFAQAYQSYIFNRSLSTAVREGYDLSRPQQDDICFAYGSGLQVAGMNRFDNNTKLQLPAIPLAGYAFRDGRNRFAPLVKSVLKEEDVNASDFYVKEMQEISQEGGFRQAPILCREFSYSTDDSLQVRFVLPKGAYATVLLRELMKPQDPVAAGF